MWINVKDDYGATGDGVTDDTAAIQAALDAVVTPIFELGYNHNVIYFPPGTYRITDTLVLTHGDGVRLVGVGNVGGSPAYVKDYGKRLTGAIIFWDGPPGGTLLTIKGSNTGSIENITFVGATPQKYQFSISNTAGDPGAQFLRFKSSTFANATEIYINMTNFFGVIGVWNGYAGEMDTNGSENRSTTTATSRMTAAIVHARPWWPVSR
ncbi:MAG TPA: glycosyl hydrolase family 28-related protein [Tepidisphaeraceae bacterium]|nr:glycosyl hydrolase family 28-related protein [Tepidisphaeraceae bacterium]